MGEAAVRTASKLSAAQRERDIALTSSTLSAFLMIALAGVIPLVLIGTNSDGDWSTTLALAALVLVWSGARLAVVIGRGAPALFDFVLWLFLYAFIGLPMVSQLLLESFPTTTPGLIVDLVPEAVAIVAASLPLLELGRWLGRKSASRAIAATDRPQRVISMTKAAWLAVFGLAVSAFYINRIGPGTFLTDRETMTNAAAVTLGDPTTAAIIAALAILPLLVSVHAIVLGNRLRRREGLRPQHRFLALMSAAILLFEVNIFTSSRYIFGTIVLSLVVLFGFFATRTRARFTMLGITAIILIAFPIFGALNRRPDSSAANVFLGTRALTESGDYDAFAQLVNTIETVSSTGLHPQQILGPLLFWVPRSVWAEKPIDTGTLVGEYKQYGFTNLSAPLWAEGYIVAGWFGALAIIFITATLIGHYGVLLLAHMRSSGPLAIAGAILAFYLMILIRGSLLQASATFAVIVLSIIWVSAKPRASRAVRTPPPRFQTPQLG